MRSKSGFTLVELMIVVAIVGLLASVAIPMFDRYVKNAREAGYPIVFGRVGKSLREFWETPRMLSDGTEGFQCILFQPVGCGLVPKGTQEPWDFSCDPTDQARADALRLNGIKSYLQIGGTMQMTLGGSGVVCWQPDSTVAWRDDFTAYSIDFKADSDGDGWQAQFAVRILFNADGSDWEWYWFKIGNTFFSNWLDAY